MRAVALLISLALLGNSFIRAQSLGDSNFLSHIKTQLDSRPDGVYYYYAPSRNANLIIFDANDYKMDTYRTEVSGATIEDAVAANPDAEFVINGSLFNHNSDEQTGPFYAPTGYVVRQGSVVWNTTGNAGDAAAALRYWLGQTADTSALKNGTSAASYVFGGKGHPTNIGSGVNNIYTAHGGLVSLIWEKGGAPHKQSSKDDADLSTYNAFAVGALKGYGVIGVDRDTGLLVIAVKNNLTIGSIYDMQDDLFSSGLDRALIVDGAGSIGLYAKSHDRYIRARRHDSPSRIDTIPSYILFKKND